MLTNVWIVKAMVFPVVIYGYESWTIKKAEGQRIYAFELWCWRLLRVPWAARRSNQSILKEINPEYSLEGLKMKLQYFGHLMQRDNSLEKMLMLGKIEGRKRRRWQRMRWLDGITDSMNMNLSNISTFLIFNHKFEQNQDIRETSRYDSRILRVCHKNSWLASEEAVRKAIILSFILCNE